jgi:hypothetical protein
MPDSPLAKTGGSTIERRPRGTFGWPMAAARKDSDDTAGIARFSFLVQIFIPQARDSGTLANMYLHTVHFMLKRVLLRADQLAEMYSVWVWRVWWARGVSESPKFFNPAPRTPAVCCRLPQGSAALAARVPV